MAKILSNDDVMGPVIKLGFMERVRGRAAVDISDPNVGDEGAGGYPWTYADPMKRPIGSLFVTTDEVTDPELQDFEERYPMGKRAVALPVDESFNAGIKILIAGKETDRTKVLYEKYKNEWKQHFKLTRLYGHNCMLYGWADDTTNWQDKDPAEGLVYSWMYALPKEYESELSETDTIPNNIKQLSANFGNTSLVMKPERLTHSMMKKLCKTDKQGESVLMIMYNLLQVQIHADWSIGQALFRRASGLLAMFAPKKNIADADKVTALGGVSNHNAKTCLYIPFGWNIKDVLKPGGNMAIARTYDLITQQMAAATGIPEKILLGEVSPTDANQGDKDIFYKTVNTFREDVMKPALTEWIRKSQKAGMVDAGAITIEFGPLESKSELEKARDMVQLGAMKLLMARMQLAADTTGTITGAMVEGSPETQELVKIIAPKK
jgi:hypothetical protein